METVRISRTETATLVRAALKAAFPGVTFSVRSRSYSGGSSIDVRWTDGPTSRAVNAVAVAFEGATFDGMIDLKETRTVEVDGRRVHYGVDFIHCNRVYSPAFYRVVVARVCARQGWPVPMLQIIGPNDVRVVTDDYRVQEAIWREAEQTTAD